MSSDVKKEYLPFYYSDLDAVARHLELMAAKGWMLKSFGNTCEYEPCEPLIARFNVVLCPAKDADSPNIKPEAREFIELCEDSGWKFIDHRGPAYAFFTADETIPNIVTDEAERIEAVRRAGGRSRFLSIANIGINALQFLLRLTDALTEKDPVSRGLSIALAAFFGIAVILLAVGLITSLTSEKRWVDAANAAISAGRPIPRSDDGVLRCRKAYSVTFIIAIAAATALLIAYAMRTMSPEGRSFLAAMLTAAIPLAFIPRLFKKKRSPAAKTFIIIGLVLGYLLLTFILVLVFGAAFGAFR